MPGIKSRSVYIYVHIYIYIYIVAKPASNLFVFVIFGNVKISSSVSSFLFVVFVTELACKTPSDIWRPLGYRTILNF